jgi:hypothetical protein
MENIWFTPKGISFILILIAFLAICCYAAVVNKNKDHE